MIEKKMKKNRTDEIELESSSCCSEEWSPDSHDSVWNSDQSSSNKEKEFLKEMHACDEEC